LSKNGLTLAAASAAAFSLAAATACSSRRT